MNQYQPPFNDERQFNLPGYLMGQIFGPVGQQFPSQPGGFPGQGGQFPGFPGGQFPGQPGGGFPGYGDPGFPGDGQNVGPPNTPPPPFQPTQSQFQTFAIDPGGIRGCMYRFTYIWLRRDAFWFYPTFVGRNSIAGYRWQGNRWVYFGIDLDRIESFQCF